MELKEPESMSELLYMTIREHDGFKARAWVFKELCPKCKKGLIAKPKDPKTGRPKIRAKEYECSECGDILPKEEYEETISVILNILVLNVRMKVRYKFHLKENLIWEQKQLCFFVKNAIINLQLQKR